MTQQTVIMIATNTRGGHLMGGNPVEPLVQTRTLTPTGPESIVNADILGECLYELVNKAWAAGNDPTTIQFKVRFE